MALCVDIEKTLGSFHLRVKFEADNNVLALLGASGCGKSMTLKCIAGIETPDRGVIRLDGTVLYDSSRHINLPPQRRRVGYLFQQYALFPNMTVQQNIACGVRDKSQRAQTVQQMITAMHLDGMEHKKPHQLSGGQQQRVALARILVNAPDVLLLDEPFSALDSHLRFQMENELRSAIGRFGKTVLLVSHNRDEVFRMSDDIAIMKGGAIETIGSKKAVFADPQTVNGAILTGCKNVARIEKRGDRAAYVPQWGVTLQTESEIGDATHIGIRMHDVQPGQGTVNTLACRVVQQIENPFSYTVMLVPKEEPAGEPFGWELDKEAWRSCQADRITVCLPPQNLLLLREE